MDKQSILDEINRLIAERLERLQRELDDLKSGLASNTKSTAGDKHETSRAMAHNEQERLAVQLDQTLHQKRMAAGIDASTTHTKVEYGSLVKTDRGTFFFSLGLGKIAIGSETIFCIAANTPMGQALLGKSTGENAQMNGIVNILEVC
ncbi:MAG: hypothetical protein QNK23_05705 [Crocinitomicaceae bacterium]|nr:hypothetical protein [Crocinitomicaceae bacterium]